MQKTQQYVSYFSPDSDQADLPDQLPNPFGNEVHPLAAQAARFLQKKLIDDVAFKEDFSGRNIESKIENNIENNSESNKVNGSMYGVLVVKDERGGVGFISASCDNSPYKREGVFFVPSILENKNSDTILVTNILGEAAPLSDFVSNSGASDNLGNGVAINLLQFAIKQSLKPLALAEFWWGDMPADRVRHHGYYYPSPGGACGVVLSFLLKGLKVKPLPVLGANFGNETLPEVIYEDETLLVVNKPAGLLSVPGKEVNDSVLSRLKQRYPEATGPLLLHRLDLATSGLLLVAKNSETHKLLQTQFLERTIEKRYVALLSKPLVESGGTINLPLRVDIDDRPNQLVCHEHGKAAKTKWKKVCSDEDETRVYFYPITGRTHQLRVHASHINGLNSPIIGDTLYGKAAKRLMLHAEKLSFTHPVSGERIVVKSTPPF
ncbi:MAG: RluA family pseudouridine synthase [Gammaproteobacteria bacterium]|nr:RluA family pseudouridine synthase [Gammaproteobacteria bacterium]